MLLDFESKIELDFCSKIYFIEQNDPIPPLAVKAGWLAGRYLVRRALSRRRSSSRRRRRRRFFG